MKIGLQIVLGVLSLIPIAFALLGLLSGAGYYMPDGADVPAALDNQFRYLSGVYALVTFLIWWAIPRVERQGFLLAFICLALVIGGLGRLVSMLTVGEGQPGQMVGMAIELGSPLLLVWQRLLARKTAASA